jgi:hypothetical protein
MSQIIKAFMGIFLTLFMAVTSLGILTAYLEVMSAQDMQAKIVDEIENSDFAPVVMRECFDKCSSENYSLTITLFCDDRVISTMHSKSEVPNTVEGVELAKVEMKFTFGVPFLGISKDHTFSGYAR